MPISHGFETVAAVSDTEPTYGTAIEVTQKLPIISESYSEQFTQVLDNSLCGPATRSKPQQGTRMVDGDIDLHWRYLLQNLLLKQFFGTLATDTPVGGTNTYQLDAAIDGKHITFALDKTVSVHEWASLKTSELTITGNPTDGIRINASGFAHSLELSSVINTTVVLDALTASGDIMLFQDATLRIADLADAINSSDAIEISEFEITINRQLEAVEINSRERREPLENGFRESMLTITIPQYEADTFIDWHKAHECLQADLTITDGTNTYVINMPLMLVESHEEPITGPEFTVHEVTFTLHPDTGGLNAFMTLQDTDTELEIQES